MKTENYDAIVFIGRMQPPHKIHFRYIEKALNLTNNVIIVLGSCGPRTIKNPFTAEERAEMIQNHFNVRFPKQINFIFARDYLYNDNEWIRSIQEEVDCLVDSKDRIGLIGNKKDFSTYYLDLFPQWERIYLDDETDKTINSTYIRKVIFEGKGLKDISNIVEPSMIESIYKFRKTKEYQRLKEEYDFYENYKNQWSGPYPITFVTTDTVVMKSGHVLLVKRKSHPGKGLWALPGGFIRENEWLKDSAIRELKEETRIKINQKELKNYVVDQKVFDHPQRSLRGRTITHAFLVKLPEDGKGLPEVKGGSDASHSFWVTFTDVLEHQHEFFEDHYMILHHFINQY